MAGFSGIRAVTFDVGGTLLQPWPSVGDVYAQVAHRHGHAGLDAEALSRRFAVVWSAKMDFDYSRAAWRRVVDETFANSVGAPLSSALFDELYDFFATTEPWRVFEDVRPALRELKARGLKLGVISNWDERLRPLLEQTELSACFDAITISVEAGWAKPHLGIFRRALGSLGCAPQEVLHVGDDWREDVIGAQEAGLSWLLLKRHGSSTERGAIRTLTALGSLLD
jgi:putative hydrolase of the HAD superfamily